MLLETSDQPGGLPLLQYALTELFERREGSTLTLGAYRAIGGVSGALAGRAEELYGGSDEDAREAAATALPPPPDPRRGNRGRPSARDAGRDRVHRRRPASDGRRPGSVRCVASAVVRPGRPYARANGRGRARGAPALLAPPPRVGRWGPRGRPDEPPPRHRGGGMGRSRSRTELPAPRWAAGAVRVLGRPRPPSRPPPRSARYLDASLERRAAEEAAEEARVSREIAMERRSARRLRVVVAVVTAAAVVGRPADRRGVEPARRGRSARRGSRRRAGWPSPPCRTWTRTPSSASCSRCERWRRRARSTARS